MDNKFMTAYEQELWTENQSLKSQLAEQEVTIREFLKSKQNEPSTCKTLEAKITSFREILMEKLYESEYNQMREIFKEHVDKILLIDINLLPNIKEFGITFDGNEKSNSDQFQKIANCIISDEIMKTYDNFFDIKVENSGKI